MPYSTLEVIEYLLADQLQGTVEKVNSAIYEFWGDELTSGEDHPFFITMLLNIDKNKMNWKRFFEQIESALTNSEFSNHHTAIEQLILEAFSNMADYKTIDPQLLIDNIGPISKDYLIKYEMFMTGKTMFT